MAGGPIYENPEYNRLKYLAEGHLTDFLPHEGGIASTLAESMNYSVMAGGKRLRPVLLLAACEIGGGDIMQALPYACAVEYIHTYSLIHDDLPAMDDDDLRRGKPTNHKVFGEAAAILAGDGLLSVAFEAMIRDMLLYFDKPDLLKRRVKAAYEIGKSCGPRGMVLGQMADIEATKKAGSPELLGFIHVHKTADLITGALLAGVHLAGGDDKMLRAFESYGENLGLAFQVADDILDTIGDEAEMGKRAGHDSSAGKLTYPSIHGQNKSGEELLRLTSLAARAVARIENAEFFIDLANSLAKRSS